jgi:hypothetical protein
MRGVAILCFVALVAGGCGESAFSPMGPTRQPDLQDGLTIRGVVFETTAEGPRPILGATVELMGVLDDDRGFDPVEIKSTDEQGRFAFSQYGTLFVQASKTGYQSSTSEWLDTRGPILLNIELRRLTPAP